MMYRNSIIDCKGYVLKSIVKYYIFNSDIRWLVLYFVDFQS